MKVQYYRMVYEEEAGLYVPLKTRGYLPLFRSRTKITPS